MKNNPAHDQLATAYATLQQQLKEAVNQSPVARTKPPILMGASKGQDAALLQRALDLGLRHYGENRVQEAAHKWPLLKQTHPEIVLHLIGPLQSNKAAEAVALFDWIHTVDRPKIVEALADAVAKSNKNPRLLIQVNTGEEPQKAGVLPHQLDALLHYAETLGLPITGLMCVPPADQPPGPHFALLHRLAAKHGLLELSMGMSGDMDVAARLGATFVRVGTALFGARTL